MADEQVIDQLKQRVDFLEALVISLVAKFNRVPTRRLLSQPATRDMARKTYQPLPTRRRRVNASLLMKLPRELRMYILQKVLHAVVTKKEKTFME